MYSNKDRIVIIGATSAIAEHCARLWVMDAAIDLTLVGRNLEKTERVAADLRVRSPQSVIRVLAADFVDPLAITQLVNGIVAQGEIHIALIAHGSLPDQELCQHDLTACHEALAINGISPILFAEAFAGHMQIANHGTLAIIGSVAGDRGRKSNYVYGAAKGLVTRYAQGLQHRLASTSVKVVLIKPGPTDTPMTAHLAGSGLKLAEVGLVAKDIVRGIKKTNAVIYTPAKWKIIMLLLIHVPSKIFNKINI
jgi:decaprenylphospho-beta-D-erythro-pentofuranosid-2-ulose 2-reductase